MACNYTCEAKKDLNPSTSAFVFMYVNPTYKIYIKLFIFASNGNCTMFYA